MGRVINTNNPGKRRNHLMRTIAEILRRMGQKQGIDDEVKDMTAMIVYCLREIDQTIEESVTAWEKRNYWKKADDFQQKWWWASQLAPQFEKVVLEQQWENLPVLMVKLVPYFAEIQVNKMMRTDAAWNGCYDRLISEKRA